MKQFKIIAGMALTILTSSCTSISPVRDIHATPESVIQAMFEGYKNNDNNLILQSMAPATRQKLQNKLPENPRDDANRWLIKRWGMPIADVEISKITLKIDADHGDKKYVDAQYNGKSCGDQATVIKIDGKWYVEMF